MAMQNEARTERVDSVVFAQLVTARPFLTVISCAPISNRYLHLGRAYGETSIETRPLGTNHMCE
jgi:hypothetical protein